MLHEKEKLIELWWTSMFTSSLFGKDNKQFSFVKLYFEHKFCTFKENISVYEQYEMFCHINTQMTNIS